MTRLQGKMTVSELKKMAGEMMTGEVLYPEKPPKLLPDVENPIYMAQQKGTATHKIFELLPFSEMISKEDVSSFIHRCVEKGQIPAFWEELIPAENIFDFCESELGRRMARAERRAGFTGRGPLLWEFRYRMSIRNFHPEVPKRKKKEFSSRVSSMSALKRRTASFCWIIRRTEFRREKPGDALLIKRYKTQLDYYQKAIEQIIGKKVKDRILYSVIMNREIHC